jgi:hypothetical protein
MHRTNHTFSPIHTQYMVMVISTLFAKNISTICSLFDVLSLIIFTLKFTRKNNF